MNSLVLQLAAGDEGEPLPDFVSLPQKYRCENCKEPLLGPSQTQCGHRLCRTCLRHFLSLEAPARCPVDEEDCVQITEHSVYPDISTKKEIRELPVHCKSVAEGCIEKVAWKLLEEHLDACAHARVSCDREGCDVVLLRGDLETHWANDCLFSLVPCQLCGGDVERGRREEHLRESCLETVLSCQDCGEQNITRRDLVQHRLTCRCKPDDCKYREFGCMFQGSADEIKAHCARDTDEHLERVTTRHVQLQDLLIPIQTDIQRYTNDNAALAAAAALSEEENEKTRTVLDTQLRKMQKLQTTVEEKLQDVERLTREARTLRSRLETSDEMARGRHHILEEEQRRLGRRLENAERMGACAGGGQDVDLCEHLSQCDSQGTLLGERLNQLDVRFQCLETCNYDGILIWKIVDYQRRKDEATQGMALSLQSQPVYTYSYGYKICARVYLNGDGLGKNSHCSLFFVLMKGPYDELLHWPFRHTVRLSLLNQRRGRKDVTDSFRPDPTSSSFRQPRDDVEMNVASGFPVFVPQSTLEREPYLVNDTIFFKMEVDVPFGLFD